MKKVNNHGFTLIEMLLALAILSIFMVTVIFFMFTESRSTKLTRQQIQTQQDANEAYGTISDLIMQATCIDLRASGDAGVDYVSKAASDSINYSVIKHSGGAISSWSGYLGAGFHCTGIGSRSRYRKDKLGMYSTYTSAVSRPEYEAARMYLSTDPVNRIQNFKVFDEDKTYDISGLYFGPVITDATTTSPTEYKTIVYDYKTGNIYLNVNGNGADFSETKDNLIARHCKAFRVSTGNTSMNSLTVKLTFYDNMDKPTYRYTTGGTVVIRNGGILD